MDYHSINHWIGRSPSINEYSNMALRLLGENCIFLEFLLYLSSKKDLVRKKTQPSINVLKASKQCY